MDVSILISGASVGGFYAVGVIFMVWAAADIAYKFVLVRRK